MCSGTLLPDVMHDLLEGVLQHVIQLLLSYCIEEKKYFTLATLNEKILGIELGYMEDNRPAPLDHWKHIRQNGMVHVMHILAYIQLFLLITASQTWTMRYEANTIISRKWDKILAITLALLGR